AVEKHGADATRYGLLDMSTAQDPRFSWGKIEEGAKLANKLWNVARLLIGAVEGISPEARPSSLEERWILSRLDNARELVEDALGSFEFGAAVKALYHLTFDEFCDWYAEAIKPRLYAHDA